MTRAPRKPAAKATQPPVDHVTTYARAVVDGKLPAGLLVRQACKRHLDDLAAGKWLFDVAAADRIIRFFPGVLRLTAGKHQGMKFDLLDWQQFIVGSINGWRDPADGTRRFRQAYAETAKGSGKTPLAAGLGLYFLAADGEAAAEVYAAAATKDQADVAFRAAVSMVNQSPLLDKKLTMSGGKGRETNIAHIASSSFFKKIAADSPNSGYLVHFALVDEIHEHRNSLVIDMLEAGQKGRAQPLIFMITNTGSNKTGPCYALHTYSERVLSGAVTDDRFFAYVCGLDENDDPFKDESCWAKANPSLGQTITVEYLRDRVNKARGMPSMEGVVRRLNFCEWTDAETAWIDRDLWEKAETTFDPDEMIGVPCRLGMDLSMKRDLTAVGVCWQMPDGGPKRLQVFQWTPKDTAEERGRGDNVPYEDWIRDGHLLAAPGRMIDKRVVAQWVLDFCMKHNVLSMAYDTAQMDDFLAACNDVGLDAWIDDRKRDAEGRPVGSEGVGLRLVRHGQGYYGFQSQTVLWMPRSINTIEEAIVSETIQIQKNPLLRWNSSAAVLISDATGNRKWEKTKSNGRIDGMVAACMAVGAWAEPVEAEHESIWDDDELSALMGV